MQRLHPVRPLAVIASLALVGSIALTGCSSDSAQPSSGQPSQQATDGLRSEPATGELQSVGGPADAGVELWALVIAGATSPSDSLLTDAAAELADAGYDSSPTNCDEGAAEALGMRSGDTFTVSAYFDTEAEALAAKPLLAEAGLEGPVTRVVVACPE